MRLRPALASILLAASCGDPAAEREERFRQSADASDRIECAVDGAAAFERACTIERIAGAEGLTLILRGPGGGFRRLLVTTDGRGVIAADGADVAKVSILSDKRIEVALAGDRYRLPATVKR